MNNEYVLYVLHFYRIFAKIQIFKVNCFVALIINHPAEWKKLPWFTV